MSCRFSFKKKKRLFGWRMKVRIKMAAAPRGAEPKRVGARLSASACAQPPSRRKPGACSSEVEVSSRKQYRKPGPVRRILGVIV